MLPPVIVGVDGSAESLAAAEWAAREAVRRDRPLRLVHAWNWHPRQGAGEPATAAQRFLARRALRQAEDRIRRTCPGAKLDDEQIEGPATTALLQAADRADLLVLGSRGLSGFSGFLVGSVALGVVARATTPVVLVREGEEASDEHLSADDGSPSTHTGYRDVVLGIDLGDPCDEVIEFAFEAARARGARLHVVHAWHTPSPLVLGPGDIGLVNGPEQADEWLGFLTAVLRGWRDKYPEVEVAETVTKGRAQSVLVRAATGASLLVVGRRMTSRPTGPRTGPVTQAAIHHVGCPVAVVPHE
ncbi:universal stress protein [Streptomyces chartreusis]|uniref:universal stress protein n=1 Tax=unclassified Streptomyces TaxID=2593676 RepID=UPI0004C642CB|nr:MULTISPECIES: universal stress protein [unclassified Streptomyces]SEE07008.1 Nucleotide-binding universal stress protein, UspA family [Streptomyces sp. PAN_FS17]SEE71570.1 Nucleotide-binding universal stress protein, UspA family [Streptomyces sp. KS_5]